jgi:hypothetical protein
MAAVEPVFVSIWQCTIFLNSSLESINYFCTNTLPEICSLPLNKFIL